jgi:hypothetical protein
MRTSGEARRAELLQESATLQQLLLAAYAHPRPHQAAIAAAVQAYRNLTDFGLKESMDYVNLLINTQRRAQVMAVLNQGGSEHGHP